MPLDTLIPDEETDTDTGVLVRPERRNRQINTPQQARARPRSFELSDDAQSQLRDMARSARRVQPAAAAQPKPDKPLGLMGTIKEGAKGTLRMLGATADTMQGDAQGVVQAAQEQTEAPKDPDLKRFYDHIEQSRKTLGENPSLWEGIKAVGSAAIDNPRGFGLMVAEQLPNSGAALGAAGAGALAGSFAGPVGAAVGGLAGLATANIGLETGAKALEAAQDKEFTPEEQSRVRREGLVKGSAVSIVDVGTLGLTKFITNASRRAVESATVKTLADNGVDVANSAARKAAMETPEIAQAVKSAQELARQGAETLGKRLARTGGAVALETVGEGAGEYLGELAATGKANALDAVIEGFAGLGTSIGEIATTAALNRKGLIRLLDTQEEAQKKAEEETKSTGVEHEAISSPSDPEKFVAVPKVRSIAGIELERDAQGNLKPVQPASTQTDFNLANRPAFELTAEDKLRKRELEKQRESDLAKNPIITPTIAGKPVTQLPIEALNYTVNRGSTRSREIAAKELERRKQEGDTGIPEKPSDTVKRIVTTGAEKAQEDAKKTAGIVMPSAMEKPAKAPKLTLAGNDAVKKSGKTAKESQSSLQRTASWVIRNKESGEVVMETFDKKKVDALNTQKYEAVPVQEHLAQLNQEIKQEKPAKSQETVPAEKPQTTANEWNKAVDSIRPDTVQSRVTKASASQAIFRAKEGERLRYGVTAEASKRMAEAQKGAVNLSKEELEALNDRLQTRVSHKDVIEKALKEGRLVPDEVLNEYPHLRKDEQRTSKPLPTNSPESEGIKTQSSPPQKANAGAPTGQKTDDLVPADSLRPHIESLIKRRAAASQTGKDRSVNNAINRAKEVMDGKRTDNALESKWFRAQAAVMRKSDPETAEILGRIGEAIKTRVKLNTQSSGATFERYAALGNKTGTVQQAIADAEEITGLRLGLPIVFAKLRPGTPARFIPESRTIEVSQDWNFRRDEGAQYLAEELFHAVDVLSPTHTLSASSKRLDLKTGDIAQEVIKHHDDNGVYESFFQYPLADNSLTESVKKAELFARLAVLYFGEPARMQRYLPISYGALNEIFRFSIHPVSGEISRRLWTFTGGRPPLGSEHRTNGKNGSGNGGSSQDRQKAELGRLRKSIRGQFKADSLGGKVDFGRVDVRSFNTVNASSRSTPASPLRDRFEKITDSLIYNFQDRFKPLKDTQKRAGPVSEDEDAALAEERYSGMVRSRLDNFEDQLRDPLLKAIHDSGVAYEDVEKYLHALHAPSRNAAMKEINPTEAELKAQLAALEKQRDTLSKDAEVKRFLDLRRELRQAEADIEDGIADESLARSLKSDIAQIRKNQNVKDYAEALDKLKGLRLVKPYKGDNTSLSGMSDKEAADILAKADKDGTRAKLDKISGLVDAITQQTRQIYVDSGLEKADAINAWNQKYQHYVPLHRDEVGGNTMPKVGQGFNIRGKESKRATGSTKAVTDILAHVVAQHEAAIIRSEKARVDRTLFQFAKTHPNPSLWTLDNAPKLRTVDPVTGFVVERVDPTYKNRPEVLTLKIDGEEHTITFETQNQEAMRLAASMKNMTSQEMGEVTQMVGRFTRFLATMNTTANPVFTARNFMRDLQTTFVNLSDTALAAKKAEVFRDIPAAIKGMWALSRGKGNSQWAKYAQEFKAAGGQTGWMDHYKDIGTRADALRKELEAMKPGKLNATRRTVKSWVDIVNDANNAVENGARLSAYVNARKSGLSEGRAAQLAKNLTVNFNTKGAKSVELNAWYMFMNASIQGTARLIKAMNNRQVRKIVAGIILSGFLMDVLARAMAGDDDEDGENDYDQLPEHTKAMNMVFMVGGQPVTVPMPYGYNFFASAGRKVSEMIFRENYSPVKSATDLASIFLDAFSPVGQAGSGLQFAAPTVADPFVQWAENTNFAGNPLRKDQSTFGVPKPEYQMGFKSTSAPAKWLAEALNNATGGNEVRPGFINVNPTFFDFTVSSIAGGAGRTYLQTVSGPAKTLSDDEVKAREVPFLNIFVGTRPEYQTERKYFEAVADVELAQKELATYRQKGDPEMVKQIREEHAAALRLISAAKETDRILTRLRKRDLALDKVDAENKRELRREIEERKREVMSRFNKKYREAINAET